MYVHIYTCSCVYVCTNKHTYTCIYTYIPAYIHIYIFICKTILRKMQWFSEAFCSVLFVPTRCHHILNLIIKILCAV